MSAIITPQRRQRAWHTLTAYHWRYNRARPSGTLGFCTCGWQAWFMRRLTWQARWQALTRGCWLHGHVWDASTEVHAGEVGFEESADTLLGAFVQCQRCETTRTIQP